MKNKSGVFWGLYLVALTFFMIGVVALIFVSQKDVTKNTMSSPVYLRELVLEKELAEVSEKSLIRSAIISEGFDGNVKEKFCDFFSLDGENLREFVFEDLVYQGRQDIKIIKNSVQNQINFCNNVYEFKRDGDTLFIKRKELKKRFVIEKQDNEYFNFPIEVEYDFSKEYSFDRGDFPNT